jgi:hypothetical protein
MGFYIIAQHFSDLIVSPGKDTLSTLIHTESQQTSKPLMILEKLLRL